MINQVFFQFCYFNSIISPIITNIIKKEQIYLTFFKKMVNYIICNSYKERAMNIHTGKLASNSTSFIKEAKKQDSSTKTSKIKSNEKENISSKLLKDFPEIKTDNKAYRSRLVNINKRLTEYETNLSKAQFIEEKLKTIEVFQKANQIDNISDLIESSTYKNEKILKNYFTSNKNFDAEIQKAKNEIQKTFIELDNEFKAIEITSQNIISLYSYPMNINDNSIKNLNLEELINTTNLDNKRVMDLIS